MDIRLASTADAVPVLEIYAPIVETTHISFEEKVPTANEMRARIAEYGAMYPWLVAEDANGILGYAYACAHRERAAYRWSVDTAVYIRHGARGRGLGRALYAELVRMLKLQGFHSAFAGIALPNEASIALHRSAGFSHVGIYRHVGYKDGAWRDTSWWQLRLNESDEPPQEPRPIRDVVSY